MRSPTIPSLHISVSVSLAPPLSLKIIMTAQLLRSPPVNRRLSFLGKKKDHRVGEVAGRTTADLAAVCCCCPCTVMNLVVLAVYKVPIGLCRKALKKKKKKERERLIKQKNAMFSQPNKIVHTPGFDDDDWDRHRFQSDAQEVSCKDPTVAVDFDMEMSNRFYGAGFWRSPSQREV
ncbi:hypothetical protein ACSBR2_033722 [Camellia fascicularis]